MAGGLRATTSRRPMKVERTRKQSEGFPLDRKVEKKKGEELLPILTAAQGL